jgi:hypothetical protein
VLFQKKTYYIIYKVKNKLKKVSLIIVLLGIIIPFFSFAESQIQIQESEINIELIPEKPKPYQNVTINISSYATDLNKALITWKMNNVSTVSGIGRTSYSFKTEGPDTMNTIEINIKPFGSMETIKKRVNLNPSEVELMWESISSYTPPFYKGKALPVEGELIKVVAIPNTTTIKYGIGSLTYSWENNGVANTEASGYNKNYFRFRNGLFDKNNTISVTASSVTGNFTAENSIEIPLFKPKLIFYKKSPTEGILYAKALDKEISMTEDEMTIVAEPYFSSLREEENSFTFNWSINENKIQTPSKKTELTIRPTSRGGYATINLVVENINSLFQKFSNNLRINI